MTHWKTWIAVTALALPLARWACAGGGDDDADGDDDAAGDDHTC